MKIQGHRALNPLRRSSFVNAPKGASKSERRGEDVQVSSLASKMSAARAPEVIDEARIEAIRAKIEEGTFPIDPQAIARRMLNEEL